MSMFFRNFLPKAGCAISFQKRMFVSSANLNEKPKHLSYCISSWFCVPEKGMQEFEFLSRASGFIVKSRGPREDQKNKSVLRIMASAHVIFPFMFPNYYPVEQYDWLHEIRREHIQARLEIRKPDGGLTFSTVLSNSFKMHPTRDLAALRAQDDDELISQLKSITHDIDGVKEDCFISHELRDTTLHPRDEVDCYLLAATMTLALA
eukprot:30007-Hanusia_phi.AAC.3